MIYYLFDNISYGTLFYSLGTKYPVKIPIRPVPELFYLLDPDPWSVNQDYGSLESDPESKEIFMDPQPWIFGYVLFAGVTFVRELTTVRRTFPLSSLL